MTAVALAGICALAAGLGLRAVARVYGAPLAANTANSENSDMITVRIIGKDGQLTDPVSVAKVERTDGEWQKLLTPEQYVVSRSKGTERPFCGTLLDNKKKGYYLCIGCNLPLFHSGSKFESGTGWPSFFQPVAKENILEERDISHGMLRTEVMCARCEGHLGHVFEDGPKPTGLRFCLNSESLKFIDDADAKTVGEEIPVASLAANAAPAEIPKAVTRLPLPTIDTPKAESAQDAKAVFAGGCFWCTEAVFEDLPGVKDVVSGYAGGDPAKANYDDVSAGDTGHAEAIEITYDASKLTYGELMRIFMGTHNPTQLNAQGPDTGTQYRSAIFYIGDKQKEVAEKYIAQLDAAKLFGAKPIETTLEPFKTFHPAEEYHQNFAKTNPAYPYVKYWLPEKLKKRDELISDTKK